MGCLRALCATLRGRPLAGVLLVSLFGCAMVPPNSFIDPTKVGRFGLDSQEGGIRRVLTPRDTPPGLASATDPTPEDLVAVYEDYRLMSGDVVAVSIEDLLTGGRPFAAALQVSNLGEIRIPELGSIRVVGLTEQELEQEIGARLKEAGLLPKPVVVAAMQLRRGRIFTVLGAVAAPGAYQIADPDLRLLDAVGMAGDVGATAKRIYVIRRGSAAGTETPSEPVPTPPAQKELVIPPPVDQDAPPGGLMTMCGTGRLPAEQGRSAGTAEILSADRNAAQEPPTKQELADIMSPATKQSPAGDGRVTPVTQKTDQASKPVFQPLIFDPQTGRVMQAEPEAPQRGVGRASAPANQPPAPVARELPSEERLEKPFDWENVEESQFEQRVIAIDVTELKNGNPRYNVVVRDRDVVNVPIDTGVFYMMGEVNRPGVYAFGGRDITIKQALAIVGGFSAMAWPQRCEVIRREPGTDKQLTMTVNLDAIWAGMEEDFFLRDDDIVNVGTHIVAPFLYVIRNSFRFTYGFGFVYDRNFADKDSYGGRTNPETLAEQRRALRGLSF